MRPRVRYIVEGEPPDSGLEEEIKHLPGLGLLVMDEEIAWRQLTGYLRGETECPYGCNRGSGERCPACA